MLKLVQSGHFKNSEVDSARAKVLIIQPSTPQRNLLRQELEAVGYTVITVDSGTKATEHVRDHRPELVMVDAELKKPSGLETLITLRENGESASLPILFLSKRNELKDKLAGFDAGASDYITKPFFSKELIARLDSWLRSTEPLRQSENLGRFYLDMLWGLGSTISSLFSHEDQAEVILRQTMAGAESKRGALYTFDEANEEFTLRAKEGYRNSRNNLQAVAKMHALLPKSAVDSLNVASYCIEPLKKPAGHWFIPMIVKDKLTGALLLELKVDSNRLPANDQKMLFALASQAAMLLENSRLEHDSRSMFLSIIASMAGAIDAKDPYTHGHSLRVASVALRTARQMGLTSPEQETLMLSAILHDVGKIAIPDSILQKPTPLTEEEFEIMKGHTLAGEKLLAHIDALQEVLPGIKYHHEYWNGQGYPEGLKQDSIPLIARIIHISDAFDAITTDRVYRPAQNVEEALEHISELAGTQFDPRCVKALLEARRQGFVEDDLPKQTPTLQALIDQVKS